MMITIGRIVLYKLSENDVKRITHLRLQNNSKITGANYVTVGEEYPLISAKIWPNEYGDGIPGVNGQVILDGPDVLWVTSVKEGTENGQWHWPVIAATPIS